MASIHSMEIRGIRSFGTDASDEEKIKFLSPITCIVGQNGCGKTTIIECLRYATTGLAPPGTDKGRSFVYDPKLTRANESLGQVKLRFNTTKKGIMQIKRSIRCNLQRSGKLEMKTMEPTLEYKDKHGETRAISGRCQDVSSLVYDNLGVSQAILDNVIFCHQDDSNWPLDEPKKLKEKFDDIFDAARYNKASEGLTKLIKKKNDELKIARNGLDHYKTFKEMADRKKEELQREQARYQESVQQVEKLQDQKRPMEKELSDIHHRENHYSELNTKISTLKSSKENYMSQQEHLKKQIKKLHRGSKKDLETEIRNFEAELKNKEREISDLEEQVAKLNTEDRSLTSRIQKEQMELGKLTQEEKNYQDALKKRFEFLQAICKDLKKEFSMTSPDDKKGAEKSVAALDKGVQDFEANLKQTVAEQDQVEKALEDQIYKCRDEFSKSKDKVEQLKNQLEETRKTLKSNSDEVKKVDQGLSKVTVLENRLERVTKELKAEEDTMNVEQSQRDITSTQADRKDLEDEGDVIAKEINTLQLAKGFIAEAEVYKKSIEEKKTAVQTMMEKHMKSLKELFTYVPDEKLKSAVDDIIKKNEREKMQLQKALQDAKDSQCANSTELKHLNKQLQEAEQRLKVEQMKIKKECGDRDLDSVLRETESELQSAQDQKGELDSSSVLFKRYAAQLRKEDPCCPLCHRGFDSGGETNKLIKELESKISNYPTQIAECAKKQKDLQTKQSKLQQLIPSVKKIEDLQMKEVPQIQEEIGELEMSIQVAKAEEKSATNSLKAPENKLRLAELVKSDMAIVDKYQEELAELEKQLRQVEEKMPATGAGRSLEDAQADQERIRSEIQRLQKAAEEKQRALNQHQIRLNEMKDRKNSLNAELLEIKSGQQKRTQLLDQVKQLTEKEKQLTGDLEEAKEAVAPSSKALTAAEDEKRRAKASHGEIREKQQSDLTNLKSRLSTLKVSNKSVETFEARNLSRKLEDLKATVEKLSNDKEDLQAKKEDTANKQTRLQKDLVSQNVKQRDLTDNMRLLELAEKVVEVEEKLAKLQEEVGDLNYVELMDKKKKLNSDILKIMNEVSRLEGSQKELKSKVDEIKRELNKDQFKNAETKYNDELVKTMVEERIVKDMQQYQAALFSSVIHFHKERMSEVNRIIRELWVGIYKGSDIDYIAIKTEADDKETVKTKRNYNYRVVMVKSEQELDMRGRCSAGQKMLASLVIRIALAETFSASCGILALDEPTTNLDATNIESLGTSLIDLAKSHRLQKNFQLLIITHDEDFIERLQQAELIDAFYRVTRDALGHSKIKKFRVDGTDAAQNGN